MQNIISSSSISERKQILDVETSNRITSLRYFLMVLIIFLHNSQDVVNFSDNSIITVVPPVVKGIKFLVTDCICPIAVPLYFFISGYLLFLKEYSFKDLLLKKTRSILIPYVIWISLYAFCFAIFQSIPAFKVFFSNPNNLVKDFGLKEWFGAFWGRDLDNNHFYIPLAVQFWFIRDLLIVTVFSPIIRRLYNKTPVLLIIIVTGLYLHPVIIYSQLATALFFMVLALFIVKSEISLKNVDCLRMFDIVFTVLGIWILKIILYYLNKDIKLINIINILITSILFVKIAKVGCNDEKKFLVLKKLSIYSFWLFAIHMPFIEPVLIKLWARFLPQSGYYNLISFFSIAILTLLIGTISGIVMRKTFPSVFSLVNGGRIISNRKNNSRVNTK